MGIPLQTTAPQNQQKIELVEWKNLDNEAVRDFCGKQLPENEVILMCVILWDLNSHDRVLSYITKMQNEKNGRKKSHKKWERGDSTAAGVGMRPTPHCLCHPHYTRSQHKL